MRTCSPTQGRGTSFTVEGYDCYENESFSPEYCAISCYCQKDKCNLFRAPPLSAEGRSKVESASSLTPSSLAIFLSLLMTAVVVRSVHIYAK